MKTKRFGLILILALAVAVFSFNGCTTGSSDTASPDGTTPPLAGSFQSYIFTWYSSAMIFPVGCAVYKGSISPKRIYVGGFDYNNSTNTLFGRIFVLDDNGEIQERWGDPPGSDGLTFDGPTCVAVGSDGQVFVADTDYGLKGGSKSAKNEKIMVLDKSGNLKAQWNSAPTLPSRSITLDTPNDIAVHYQSTFVGDINYIYVVDKLNRVVKFAYDGGPIIYVTNWGTTGSGAGQFNDPRSVATGPRGYVYVADSGNNRIQKFDPNGNFVASWDTYDGVNPFQTLQGIDVDDNGNIYVLDVTIGGDEAPTFMSQPDSPPISDVKVRKLDSSGIQVAVFGKFGEDIENFMWPLGISTDRDENIYAVDNRLFFQMPSFLKKFSKN